MHDEQSDSKCDQQHLDDLKQKSATLRKKHGVTGATLKKLNEESEELLKARKPAMAIEEKATPQR